MSNYRIFDGIKASTGMNRQTAIDHPQFQGVAAMTQLAWIGLGVMGFPMAGHLARKSQLKTVVYNRTTAKALSWVEKNSGQSAPTPKAAATGADVVFACVGNDDDLRTRLRAQ